MNERTYSSGPDRLRSEERIARLEVERVASLCIENANIKSMLDVGTGSALFAEEFQKRNIKTAGIDFNPEMIEAAKKHLPDGEFKLSTAEEIPYEDNSFDLVFLGLVFHEVDDFTKALAEAKRVSREVVALLEWDYVEQEFGPPLKDRLKREFVKELSENAGFSKFEIHPLKNLILYKLYR